jgi:triphosphoribosyl-dephospho-CoA synthase
MVAEEGLMEGEKKPGQRIGQAAQIACLLEVSAPKPGNVNRLYDFADLHFEDFLLSAAAIGPAMGAAGKFSVGRTILRAIQDTRQVVSTNTNLGIVLLLAPLAKAAARLDTGQKVTTHPKDKLKLLREKLKEILFGLTVEDAQQVYAAIRLAQAGALGQVSEGDVAEEPEISLLEAMALAQERDAIAREYVSGYAISFEIGYPALVEAYHKSGDLTQAIVQAYLTILSQVPDTLIARKRGIEMAKQVSLWSADALAAGGVLTPQGQEQIANLDRRLREGGNHSLNPGTTADLTCAAIFIFLVCGEDLKPFPFGMY